VIACRIPTGLASDTAQRSHYRASLAEWRRLLRWQGGKSDGWSTGGIPALLTEFSDEAAVTPRRAPPWAETRRSAVACVAP